MNMTFNPPIRHTGIEVTSVNEAARTIHMIVYIFAHSPLEVQTPTAIQMIDKTCKYMVKYMEDEAFIKPGIPWLMHTGAVVIPPQV
jgi:hypothetical protein